MAQRIGGFRRKTRHKLKKSIRERGKVYITQYMQSFKTGDKVILKINPSLHRGMLFPRFHGKVGKVAGVQGACYKVAITDGDKHKTIIVHPGHLRREGINGRN